MNMNMNKSGFMLAAIAQLYSTTAWAQDSQAADDAESGFSIDEIVVTAQKRSERLQDVPIAVNVVNSEQLANSGISDLQELNILVPGLNIVHTLGAFLPSIRGISTSSNVVENPVALVIDGVYLPNQREGLRDLADIEQITVLKGPQGTLFGRNATAGIIQITTKRPSFSPSAEVKLSYGSYETIKGNAYVTAGLTDKIAASVSLSYATQGEGWGKSLTSGFDVYKLDHSFSARGKLLFLVDDSTEITLIGDYLDRRDAGSNYQPYPGTSFSYAGFGPVSSRYDTYAGTPGYNSFKGGGVSLEVDHDFDFAKLVSISSYRDGEGAFQFDFTNVALPYLILDGKVPSETYTQEFQLISPDSDSFQWVAGVFYIHNELGYVDFNRTAVVPFPALPGVAQVTGTATETTESIAPFFQTDISITPSTTLTLGGRWTYEKRKIEGANAVRLANGFVIPQPAVTPSTQTIKEPSWRVALNQQVGSDISVYASYNRGIKSGGYNIGGPNLPSYKPEKLDAWEVGFKSQLLDRLVTFNMAAFYYSYRNLQVSTFLENSTSAVVTNGAEAELYGIDVDFQVQITDAFSLRGGLEAMQSKFTNYGEACATLEVNCAPISSPLPGGSGVSITPGNATGNRLPMAQDFVGTLAADFEQTLGNVIAHLNVTGTYNGSYHFEPDNFIRQPSYVMLNSSLRLSDEDDSISLTFAANNILDEAVIARNITQAYAYYVNYGSAPRTYTVTLGAKF